MMARGIIFAFLACFIWGWTFIIPRLIDGFTFLEVVLGRLFFYGVASTPFLLREWGRGRFHYPPYIWRYASLFAFTLCIGYCNVVLALRYASPAICALIIGLSPITISLYGNWKQREFPFSSLLIPSILILSGLLMVNIPNLQTSHSLLDYSLGLLFAAVGLACWTWFAVHNSRFLKDNPHVPSDHWCTLIGFTCLFWVFILSCLWVLWLPPHANFDRYLVLNSSLLRFFAGCATLGIICSWLGGFFWNKASFYLPVSVAGQLIVFETIFGLLFVYILQGSIPPILECTGIALFIGAVCYSLRIAQQRA